MALKRWFSAAVLCGTLLTLPAAAQFIGYVSPQTVEQTLATATACTGAPQRFAVRNLGQTQHYLQISNVGAAVQFQAQILGFDTQGNYYVISDTASTGQGTNISLAASGFWPKVMVQVTCSPNSVTYNASYSGAWGTSNVPAGSLLATQVEKPLWTAAAQNANQSITMQTPFGATGGQITSLYSGGSGAGGYLQVNCTNGQGSPIIALFQLANNTAQQTFQVPDYACAFVSVTYINDGSAGTISTVYLFSPPGRSTQPAYQYSHITGTTATEVKAAVGFLHALNVNTAAAGTVTIFDLPNVSCTGTPATNTVAVVTVPAATNGLPAFLYDVNFLYGLCVKASVAMDLTVSYQ